MPQAMGSGSSAATLVGNVVAIKRLVRTRASAFLIIADKNESYFTVWPDNFGIYTASQSNFSPSLDSSSDAISSTSPSPKTPHESMIFISAAVALRR